LPAKPRCFFVFYFHFIAAFQQIVYSFRQNFHLIHKYMIENDANMVQTSSQVHHYIKHDADKRHTSQIWHIQVYKFIIASKMRQTSPQHKLRNMMATTAKIDILDAYDGHNIDVLQVWKQNHEIHSMDNFNEMEFYKRITWE
jgi:hypothetical protein